MDVYNKAYHHAISMIAQNVQSESILSYLTSSAEEASPGTVASILLLDKTGLLRNGSSPKLPVDYIRAIDGLKPHPKVGTCAAAAATASMVITEDFYDDSKWSELRHLPLALGFKGAWSMPIIDDDGKVLGTFGTYFPVKRKPTQDEIDGVTLLARAAAMALLHH